MINPVIYRLVEVAHDEYNRQRQAYRVEQSAAIDISSSTELLAPSKSH